MSEIDRYNGNFKAFGINATGSNRTIFGSESQSDTLNDNMDTEYFLGWEIVGANDFPTLEDFSAMGFTLGQTLAYLHQRGVASWNNSQEYYSASIVNYGGNLYTSVSTITANINHTPSLTDDTWWRPFGKLATTDMTYDVGATGDFLTINAALAFLSLQRPLYSNTGIRATITLEAGFAMEEQIICNGIDLSWIQIDSADAFVDVFSSALTISVNGISAAIVAANGGKTPVINFNGDMQAGSAKYGMYALNGGIILGDTKLGIKNSTTVGMRCDNASIICNGDIVNSGSGATGTMCNGGIIKCFGDIDNSGSGTDGVLNNGGTVSSQGNMDNSGCGGDGINNNGGTVSSQGNMDNSGSTGGSGIVCSGGSIECNGDIDNSSAFNSAVSCFGGSVHSTGNMLNSPCTSTEGAATYCVSGRISCNGTMNCEQIIGTPVNTDLIVLKGGIIVRNAGNGATDQTFGTMDANGYINQ